MLNVDAWICAEEIWKVLLEMIVTSAWADIRFGRCLTDFEKIFPVWEPSGMHNWIWNKEQVFKNALYADC